MNKPLFLTNKEKELLGQAMLQDLPDYFFKTSLGLGLAIVQATLSTMALALLFTLLVSKLGLDSLACTIITSALALAVVVPNILLVCGIWQVAVKALKRQSQCFMIAALALFEFSSIDHVALSLFTLALSLAVFFIVGSPQFLLFASHKKQMTAWMRERKLKNRALIQQIRQNKI